MPTSKSLTEMSVEELEKKYKVKAQDAQLSLVNGEYRAKVGAKEYKLDPNTIISPEPLQQVFTKSQAAGKVIIAGGKIVIIIIGVGIKFVPILCYIPADIKIVQRVNASIRQAAIREVAKANELPVGLVKDLSKALNETAIAR